MTSGVSGPVYYYYAIKVSGDVWATLVSLAPVECPMVELELGLAPGVIALEQIDVARFYRLTSGIEIEPGNKNTN